MKKSIAAIASITLLFAAPAPSFARELPTEEPSEEATQYRYEVPSEEATQYRYEHASDRQEEDDSLPFEISSEWINLYIDNTLTLTENRVISIGGDLFVPAEETALLLALDASLVPFSDTAALCISHEESSAYLFKNSYYAIINHTALNMPLPCWNIDGVLYAPLSIITDTFGVSCIVSRQGPDPDLFLTSFKTELAARYDKEINSRALKSDTNYLIWVSKGDYSVRLFRRAGSKWVFEREFPCAIGAPSTPTCEGVYKFYERVAAWRYDTYYVGPVMRFNGGYALHSTLLNYNGTPKNNRVGVKISHGCVRLRPEDINYLFKTVPLYTTVYVSAD